MADAGENGRVRDLVAVEVQDRQHRPVPDRVDELVGVPGSRERTSFRLAVPDHAGDDQIGVVESRAVGVREAVAKLAALMNGSRSLRRYVRTDVAGERKLLEEPPQTVEVFALVRIDLGVRALEVCRAEDSGRAVTWAGHEDDVEVRRA